MQVQIFKKVRINRGASQNKINNKKLRNHLLIPRESVINLNDNLKIQCYYAWKYVVKLNDSVPNNMDFPNSIWYRKIYP